jgi:hypothetical protein
VQLPSSFNSGSGSHHHNQGGLAIPHFLEERANHTPVLQKQVLSYIHLLKADEKWPTAAFNAKVILEKAVVHLLTIVPLQNIQ